MQKTRSIDLGMKRLLGAAAIGAVAVTGFGLADATLGTPAAHAGDIQNGQGASRNADLETAFSDAYNSARAGGADRAASLEQALGAIGVPGDAFAYTLNGSGYGVEGAMAYGVVRIDDAYYTIHDLRDGGTYTMPDPDESSIDGRITGAAIDKTSDRTYASNQVFRG